MDGQRTIGRPARGRGSQDVGGDRVHRRADAIGGPALDRPLALLHVQSLGRGKIAFLASLDSPSLLEQTIEFLAGEAPVSVHPSQKRAVLTQQPQKRRWILHLLDEGSYDVDVSHAWAAASRVVAQYPATGWGYSLETTSAGLRIGVRGDADDRLLVLE